MRPRFLLFLAALFFLTTLLGVACVSNPEDSLEKQARELEASLICPICPNQTLAVSDNQLAQDMKALIRSKLAQGETKEEIIQYFVESYGEVVLAAPPRQGFNLILYLLPFAVLLIGGYLLWLLIRSLRRRRQETPPPRSLAEGEDLQEYLRRAERDLENYRK